MPNATRSDGNQTKQRLIHAAAEIFATEGFHNATTAAICDKAKANVAAISYHFCGKQELYVAVWQHAFDQIDENFAINAGLQGDESAEQRLQAYVHSLVQIMGHNDGQGLLQRIELHEMVRPTGLVDEVFAKAIEPRKKLMNQVIRDLLHPYDTPTNTRRCEFSVVSLCKSVRFAINRSKIMFNKNKITPQDLNQLAEHIYQFSLAGIQQIKQDAAAQKPS